MAELMRLAAATAMLVWLGAGQAWAGDIDPAAASIIDLARSLGISKDETRPRNQVTLDVLGRPMVIGGQLSLSAQWRGNYTLADSAGDDQIKTSPYLQLEDIWALSDTLVAFTSVTPQVDTALYREGGGVTTDGGIDLTEAWLLKTRLFGTPLALQVGRQLLQDEREWWWNQDLDSVRLHYFGGNLTAFIGVGAEIGHKSTLARTGLDDGGVVRMLGNVRWTWSPKQTLEAYFLNQWDRSHELVENGVVAHDPSDQSESDLTWFGLRARGHAKGPLPFRVYYSADVAGVTGSRISANFTPISSTRDLVTQVGRQPVRGWAFDTSLTFDLPVRPHVYLTLGYAKGSGHHATDGSLDYAYQQSGLGSNAGKFKGLGRFHYYGELLRPELSNLAVSTVSLGVPIGRVNSVEVLWHNYRQPVADNHVQGSYLGMDPNGMDNRIGDEFDLILSRRPNDAVDFEFVTGAFRAGPAFGAQDGAWATLVKAKVNVSF